MKKTVRSKLDDLRKLDCSVVDDLVNDDDEVLVVDVVLVAVEVLETVAVLPCLLVSRLSNGDCWCLVCCSCWPVGVAEVSDANGFVLVGMLLGAGFGSTEG